MKKKEIINVILFFIVLLLSSNSICVYATYLVENTTWGAGLTGVQWVSQAWGDLDNDGDWDLALIGCTSLSGSSCDGYLSKIYVNNGINLTENSTWQQNLTAVNYGSIAWGDVDNDGDLDLALTGCNDGGGTSAACNSGEQSFIYVNNGTSLFENSTWKGDITNVWKGSVAFGDINLDGKLDLALTGNSPAKIAKIYINNGTGFEENSTWQNDLTAVFESAIAFGDVDNDGSSDISITLNEIVGGRAEIVYKMLVKPGEVVEEKIVEKEELKPIIEIREEKKSKGLVWWLGWVLVGLSCLIIGLVVGYFYVKRRE